MATRKSMWNLRRLTVLVMLVLAAIVVFQNGNASRAYGLEASENLPGERIAKALNPTGPSEPTPTTGEKRL